MSKGKFNLEFIQKAAKGRLLQKGRKSSFDGISTDSRKIRDSEVFIALKGENFDGHNFISDVIQKGVKCLVISTDSIHTRKYKQISVIKVKDTLNALGEIAKDFLKVKNPLIAGITGSSGKTTTKEMTASVLMRKYSVLKTEGNLNNLIGLPLTVLKLEKEGAAVLEMGTNAFGEIKRLSLIAQPDAALITNVGEAHLEGLGSVEGVAKEKREIFSGLKKGGTAVINADDPYIVKIAGRLKAKKITFGIKNRADISADKIEDLGIKGERFVLKTPEGSLPLNMKVQGRHNIYNALAAASIGYIFGVPLDEIKKALDKYSPYSMRFEVIDLKNKAHLVNDCYNANPSSMRAALETVSSMAGACRKLALLGDMKELGAASSEAHRGIGALAARLAFDKLFLIGREVKYAMEGALSQNFSKKNIFLSNDKQSLFNEVRAELRENDWILVKGSRAMKLEEIVKMLKEEI